MKASTFVMMLMATALLLLAATGCDRTITRVEQVAGEPTSCFECHGDNDTRLVSAAAQYANSQHATGANIDRNYPPCVGCHVSEGFVTRAVGGTMATVANPTAIHCFTCHAPHTNGNFALRLDDPQTLKNGVPVDIGAGNLCVACHQALQGVDTYVGPGDVTLSTRWGPHHGGQGDMLFGTNGYEYVGYDYEDMYFHRTLNEDGCVNCHFDYGQNYVVGGHSFAMEGDVDGEEIYNTGACENCHEDYDTDVVVGFNFEEVQEDVVALALTLEGLLDGAGLIVDGLPADGLTASADSAGAVWNWLMVEDDRSEGVHNPWYIMGLLESSIMFLEGDLPQAGKVPVVSPR